MQYFFQLLLCYDIIFNSIPSRKLVFIFHVPAPEAVVVLIGVSLWADAWPVMPNVVLRLQPKKERSAETNLAW